MEKDADAHRFVVDAKGKDKRGNGTAGAKVTVTMTDAAGSTDVSVETDLAITGKPAQFGRGVMQDVSDKLLGQFVSCLEQRLTAPRAGARASEPRLRLRRRRPRSAADVDRGARRGRGRDAAGQRRPPPPPPPPAEALDLGSAVLPVLLKSYWKQARGASWSASSSCGGCCAGADALRTR